MQVKKINNFVIKPIHGKGESDNRPIKGKDLIPMLYCVTFIVAKKNSGKTTVIANILRNCVGRDTKVVVFCATLNNDPTWVAIREMLENLGVEFTGYTSIYDENKVNRIKQWLQEKQAEKEAEAEREAVPEEKINDARVLLAEPVEPEEPKIRKKKKSKYRAPETFFVFDDLSGELRDPSVGELIRVMRHHHTKIILSSQYLKDITPAAAQNVDYWMAFRGLSDEYIQRIHELGSPSMDLDKFSQMYALATKEKYGFLYAGVKTDDYRIGFSQAFSI